MLLILRLIHFLGFSAALGGAISARTLRRRSDGQTPAFRAAVEAGAASVVTKVELIALFVTLFAGIGLLTFHPTLLDPTKSGVGIWMFVKLGLVMVVLVVSHVKMFRLVRLVRERAAGASEAEGIGLMQSAVFYERIGFLAYFLIFAITIFRYAVFG